jgi:hypothetical protein
MFSLERVGRGLLALTLAGTIPLTIWGTGCGSQPLVEPDAGQSGGSPGSGGAPASGGSPGTGGLEASGGFPGAGGLPGTGGHSSGGSSGAGGIEARDASADALSQCCSQSEEGMTQCTPDGKQLRQCSRWGTVAACMASSGYSYVWQVQACPNGCVTPDGGLTGTGGTTLVPRCQ